MKTMILIVGIILHVVLYGKKTMYFTNSGFLQRVCFACSVILIIAMAPVLAQSTQSVSLSPFLVAGYSAKFSRTLDMTVNLEMLQPGDVAPKKLTLLDHQAKGEVKTYFGRSWLAVEHQGMTVFDGKIINSDVTKLYDLVSLRLMYELDPRGGDITSYEWSDYADEFQPGVSVNVGKAIRRSSGGAVLSQTEIEFLLQKTAMGYEFCEYGKTVDKETKATYVKKSCDIFDTNKKVIGTKFERLDAKGGSYIRGQGSLVVNP